MPPLGEHLMAHLFYHPHEAHEGIACLRAPKKRREKLVIYQAGSPLSGWGFHLVERWAAFRVWMLVLLPFGAGSLIFGFCWTTLKYDVQGAFRVSAWIVTLGALAVGTIHGSFD